MFRHVSVRFSTFRCVCIRFSTFRYVLIKIRTFCTETYQNVLNRTESYVNLRKRTVTYSNIYMSQTAQTILKELIKTSQEFLWIREIISIYPQSIHSELLKNRCYVRCEYSYQVLHRFFFWFCTHKEFINNFSWSHIMVTITDM